MNLGFGPRFPIVLIYDFQIYNINQIQIDHRKKGELKKRRAEKKKKLKRNQAVFVFELLPAKV